MMAAPAGGGSVVVCALPEAVKALRCRRLGRVTALLSAAADAVEDLMMVGGGSVVCAADALPEALAALRWERRRVPAVLSAAAGYAVAGDHGSVDEEEEENEGWFIAADTVCRNCRCCWVRFFGTPFVGPRSTNQECNIITPSRSKFNTLAAITPRLTSLSDV
jgi:hypothetical protein